MTLTQINKAGLDEIALDHVFTIGASGSSAYTFQGEGLNGTVNNPTLYLTRGKTYRFENGSGGHPIRIQSTSGASGTAYNTGVTNNAGSGTVIVEVQHDAPDVLYYQCTSHAAMNGILYITGALPDGGVTTAKIADSAVTTAKIADDAVTTAKIATGAVTNTEIAVGTISASRIVSGGLTAATLANDSVTTDKIADSAITNAKLNNNSITTAKINDSQITTAKLQNDAVTTAKINPSAVTTPKIADDAVTIAKLADDAVGTTQIANNAVTSDKIVDGSVTNDKIAGSTITSAKIANGTIVNADISNSALIQAGKIAEMISGNTNNRVITATGSTNTFQGESGLTFDGSNLSINGGNGARLAVIDDSNNQAFNVKHSNLSQGIGIGYDTIKSIGTNTNVGMNISTKGSSSALNCQINGNNVFGATSDARDFKIFQNANGWSTMIMDAPGGIGGHLARHVRRMNNGANSVATRNVVRIRRYNWGVGFFEVRMYATYYSGSLLKRFRIMGHGAHGNNYSVLTLDDNFTNGNVATWGVGCQVTSGGNSAPGDNTTYYTDVQVTIPNYWYGICELVMCSGYQTDAANDGGSMDSNSYTLWT